MASNETASANGISLNQNDPVFKSVGLILAITSGVFIGSSFVFKKKGLLQSQKQAGSEAGQGHSYLSNGLWWSGMILMIIGEICNFVAYAFTQAILVTPLGALSVVISAILSSIFLKERLNNLGKIGCAQCIIGATVIVLHAPNQHIASDIEEFKKMFFAPVFLTYAIVSILGSLLIIWKVAPKYGTKYMQVYIGICSLIGSLSVVTTQGLGTAIVKTIQGDNQFTHWFLYVLIAFVVITLLTEVNYLNKALNLFNTAMVTPVYYVTFTSLTIISSAILSQGFEAPPKSVVTVVMGFLVICSGIILLQYSKVSGIDTSGTLVTSTTETIGRDNRLSGSEYEPDISAIRASFGSIRRYSMNTGKTYPTLPHTMPPSNKESGNYLHRRSQSLNYGMFRKDSIRSDGGLPTINESDRSIDRKATTKSLTNPHIEPIEPIDIKVQQRPSNINDTQRKTPIIHTTSSSISSTTITASPKESQLEEYFNYKPLNINPPSPLQHPIAYIKQHLSPTASIFSENGTINSEIYSGNPNLKRDSSSSSNRRSQNSMGIVDKLKLGRSATSPEISTSAQKFYPLNSMIMLILKQHVLSLCCNTTEFKEARHKNRN
ncbi:1606_t:CDS:2 [Rhizophagus irregularis]|nr:1606_t:CDS:2 [Rhizophagus irregularis]